MDIVKVILTSLLSVATLFIIAKLIGHKQVSQLDFFDYITGITIGSVAAELATELEEPIKPFIAMVVYGSVAIVLTAVTSRFPKTRKYINGSPTIIMDGGKLYRKNMKKAKLDLSEFLVLCRQEGYFNLEDIQTAVFEYNGRLTVLPVSSRKPANAQDVGVIVKEETISTEVIMDGRILEENLKRMNLDAKWLESRIKLQGFKSADDILLGLCDGQKKLTLYEKGL